MAAQADGPGNAEIRVIAAVAQPAAGEELVLAEDELAVRPGRKRLEQLKVILREHQNIIAGGEGRRVQQWDIGLEPAGLWPPGAATTASMPASRRNSTCRSTDLMPPVISVTGQET